MAFWNGGRAKKVICSLPEFLAHDDIRLCGENWLLLLLYCNGLGGACAICACAKYAIPFEVRLVESVVGFVLIDVPLYVRSPWGYDEDEQEREGEGGEEGGKGLMEASSSALMYVRFG